MSQNFLSWLNWILHNPDLDVKLSCDHVEHFRIGHFKAKLVACDDLILSIFFWVQTLFIHHKDQDTYKYINIQPLHNTYNIAFCIGWVVVAKHHQERVIVT